MTLALLTRYCLLFSLMLLSSIAHANMSPALAIDRAASRFELAPWLDVLPAAQSKLSAKQLLAQADQQPWQALNQAVLAQGYRVDGLWLRLKINNDGLAQRRILEVTRANIGRIKVISQDHNGQWQIRHAGNTELMPRGDINGLGYSFDLNIPEGPSLVYLHLSSHYPLATPIRLSNENELFKAAQNSAGIFGTGLGLLGGVIIALLGLRSARLSIPVRWTFALLIFMVILRALADRGVLGYWWLDVPGSLHSFIQFSGCMLSIAHVFLCRQFLTQQRALPFSSDVLLWLIAIANLGWMLSSVGTQPNQWLFLADVLRWLGLLSIILVLSRPARQGCSGAMLYLVVMSAGLAGQLLNDAALRGWLPFLAEPYELIILWHLFAIPLLLHALEQSAPVAKPRRAIPINATPPSSVPVTREIVRAEPAPSLPALQRPARVLVVEDNPWVQQVLAGLLVKLDCQPSTAGNSHEAMQCLRQEHFDLVLMDCDLPDLDGISTAQLWRTEATRRTLASAADIPIIAITAHVSASYETQAREAGMSDFLQKPIDMRTLRDVLMRWLP